MRQMTHNNQIGTDELTSPGYVWFKSDFYGLPDNTTGDIGYHVVYRPLCRGTYEGTEVVTDQMMIDVREHYQIVKDREDSAHKADFERYLAANKTTQKISNMDKLTCPNCGTVCYGDCRS